MTHIVVVGMGYVGIPCAALLADVPGFRVTGVQRRSERSGWKIEWLNRGRSPFEGDEPGLAELIARVDVFEVIGLINARPDRHMHLPGAGVGGHCLPKDSWLLAYGLASHGASRDKGADGLRLIPLAREINDGMPAHMADLTAAALAETGRHLAGSKVVILGVAYLENADDTRNTPAAELARLLKRRGTDVEAHDPFVRQADWDRAFRSGEKVPLTDDLWAALRDADAMALVTKHRTYCELNLLHAARLMRTRVLVDGRNVFDPKMAANAGFLIRSVGRGPHPCQDSHVAVWEQPQSVFF